MPSSKNIGTAIMGCRLAAAAKSSPLRQSKSSSTVLLLRTCDVVFISDPCVEALVIVDVRASAITASIAPRQSARAYRARTAIGRLGTPRRAVDPTWSTRERALASRPRSRPPLLEPPLHARPASAAARENGAHA